MREGRGEDENNTSVQGFEKKKGGDTGIYKYME